MGTQYLFPKNQKLKRHIFDWFFSGTSYYLTKCGKQLSVETCFPKTGRSKLYPNEPCKRCK